MAPAKHAPPANKQSMTLIQALFGNITNAVDFGDDGSYEVFWFVNSTIVQVINVVMFIEWQMDKQTELQWKGFRANAGEPAQAMAWVPVFWSA